MTQSDIARVQAYLRRLFRNDTLVLDPPIKKGASPELRVGDEFVGTILRDDEDGEVSFTLTMSILNEDLPAAAPAPEPVPSLPRRR